SDNVTLQQANLPAVQIDVSGETGEQPEQTLTTKSAGRHKHGGVPSRENPWEIGGDISQQFNPANLGDTDETPDHEHDIDIPPHHHDVTGKTDNLGEGQSFSVVEAHTLLMCWARVA
ncbi:MAG TPA: phage tail protein, partial [Raoultella sp.]|nr:phage tail protein [Raoultella sp.]